MGNFRQEIRGVSPNKFRQDNSEWETKEESFITDPRVFFAQKQQDDGEKELQSQSQYFSQKYRKLLEREQLKKNMEEDIYKANPHLEHFNLNRLIKVRLIFGESQNEGEGAQKSEDLYQLEESDLKRFFGTFGKVEKIIIKDKCVSYVFFQDLMAAFCAQRSMNNFQLEDIGARLEIQLCVEDPEEENENKLIGHFMHEVIKQEDYLIQIASQEDEKQFKQLTSKFKYTNTFQMEINDSDYHLKERIMGASASNFFRLFYLCEKNSVETGLDKQQTVPLASEDHILHFAVNEAQQSKPYITQNISNFQQIVLSHQVSQNQQQQQQQQQQQSQQQQQQQQGQNQSEEITFKMIINNMKQTENEVIILSNNLDKYNTAVRYMHELLSQINEEYRRYCEFQKKINPGPLHIKRIEKFNIEPELMFITTKDPKEVGQMGIYNTKHNIPTAMQIESQQI